MLTVVPNVMEVKMTSFFFSHVSTKTKSKVKNSNVGSELNINSKELKLHEDIKTDKRYIFDYWPKS